MKMANMKDISFQLMKSPKELASWNFPLSEILDKYFSLLPEASKIQYGEAAFVLQNSVSAYVRRVEELYDATRSLSHKIVSKETKDKLTGSQGGTRTKKLKIDFDNFHLYEFDKEMGKNINLKVYEQKPVKCLHHCFSQLENAHAKLAIELFDVLGEVIGKKYDFRCSQQLTKSGSLVEEFAAKDFSTIENLKDAFYTAPFIYKNNNDNDNDNEFNDYNSDSQIETEASLNIQSKATNPDSTESVNDLPFFECQSNEADTYDDSHIPTPQFQDDFCLLSDNACTTYDGYASESVSDKEIDVKNSEESIKSDKREIEQTEENSFTNDINNKSPVNVPEKSTNPYVLIDEKSKSVSNDGSETIAIVTRRSKRLRADSELKSDLQSNHILKPIPFEDGIPQKLTRSRKEFQLPCHIKLLKCDSKPLRRTKRKRNSVKQESTVSTAKENNLVSKECKTSTCDSTVDSLLESESTVMKEEVTSPIALPTDHATICQELSNLTMFGPLSRTSSFTTPQSTPPLSPAHSMTSIASVSTPNITCSKSKHKNTIQKSPLKCKNKFEKDIKHKIKEIYEELDLHNDEDQKITKWHEEIKPRLKAAEKKPPFRILEYETRIVHRLESSNRKLRFDEIICQEPPCEVARYFSATLQLASRHNLNINSDKDPGKSIELILLD